jgi:hypothetical protein
VPSPCRYALVGSRRETIFRQQRHYFRLANAGSSSADGLSAIGFALQGETLFVAHPAYQPLTNLIPTCVLNFRKLGDWRWFGKMTLYPTLVHWRLLL